MEQWRIKSDETGVDEISWHILCELQKEARLSFAELGRRVGLSAPAVADRVQKMEEAGIIRGYTATLDLARVGLEISAFVRITVISGNHGPIQAEMRDMPQVMEAHRVTGEDCYIVRIAFGEMADLEPILDRLSRFGTTRTSVVVSTPIRQRVIHRGEDGTMACDWR